MHQKMSNIFQSSEAIQKLCVIVNDDSRKIFLENRIWLHNIGMYHKNVVSVSFGVSDAFNSCMPSTIYMNDTLFIY